MNHKYRIRNLNLFIDSAFELWRTCDHVAVVDHFLVWRREVHLVVSFRSGYGAVKTRAKIIIGVCLKAIV